VDGIRGGVDLGNAGSMVGTRSVSRAAPPNAGAPPPLVPAGSPALAAAAAAASPPPLANAGDPRRLSPASISAAEASRARDALRFFFGPDGTYFREFLLDEIVLAADALSREAAYALAAQLGLAGAARFTPLVSLPLGALRELAPALAPPLTKQDQQVGRSPFPSVDA
jgi:aarF domain-containing kinase